MIDFEPIRAELENILDARAAISRLVEELREERSRLLAERLADDGRIRTEERERAARIADELADSYRAANVEREPFAFAARTACVAIAEKIRALETDEISVRSDGTIEAGK